MKPRGSIASLAFAACYAAPLAVAWPPLAMQAATVPVSTAEEITQAIAKARPGDVVVMRDGTWRDQAILVRGHGTLAQPITLRAATPGQVLLTGKSSMAIEGEHLVVSGLLLQDGQSNGDGIRLGGRHNRLTECAVT